MVDSLFHAQARQRRLDEARQVQALRAEIRQEREAARHKTSATTTCLDDPKFWERVFARAERHEKILAEVRAGNYRSAPKVTATARWKSAVDAKSRTMPRSQAIMAADAENPGLRLEMLREVNTR